MADHRPLIHDDSTPDPAETTNTPALPSLGFNNTSSSLGFTPIASSPPLSPRFSRPGYTRLASDATAVGTPPTVVEEDEDIVDSFSRRSTGGLGIESTPAQKPAPNRRVSVQSIPRRPVGSVRSPSIKSPALTSPPNTGDPFLGGFPRSAASTPDLRRERFSPKHDGGEYESFRPDGLHHTGGSNTSLNNDYQQFLHASKGDAPSIKSAYQTNFHPVHECATEKPFYHSRFTWVSVSIVTICLFSTVFSGIFLGLALRSPRYGRSISSQGSFQPSDAILLTTVFAKLIELSFVTSFVAFLGQVLSRRAFMKDHGRGVTLSELSMWRWVVQPGTLITHWETAKYAGLSILGFLSLLSAILATLYSTAATALVQPMLKDGGHYTPMVYAGRVKTGFTNVNYVKSICETPITENMDPASGSTCLQLEHAGQGYHNYQRYLSAWKSWNRYGNGSSDQHIRPPGFGLLHENTTVTGQWIDIINTTKESKKYGRAVNQVSLAMPHAGVFSAARYGENDIMQPEELNSEGTYSLRASVPSPVMHVLCANVNETELAPIVYDVWPNNETVTITNWVSEGVQANATTKNTTVLDELFGWTKKDNKTFNDYPPVFPKLPLPFNTVMNHTTPVWGRESIYLLGAGANALNGTYMVCKIHVTLTPNCSTQYNATGSGGSMEALCEDRDPHMAYTYSNSSEKSVPLPDWRDIGFDWSNSMSLNAGITDGQAANARLLTELMLQAGTDGNFDLNPFLPSPAEALAVMAGCTLLMSAIDAPYVMFWNYTTEAPLLEDYTRQYFNGSVKAQQYASGGVDDASKAWMLILFLVFLMNILVLAYFLFHKGLVTDFSEPPNLFALAVNSPPSHLFAGSCGGGPGGKQYVVNWFVNSEGDHLYMEPGQKAAHAHIEHAHPHVHAPPPPPPVNMKPSSGFFSGAVAGFQRLRERGMGLGKMQRPNQERMRPASVAQTHRNVELEDAATRTQRDYHKLSKRTSVL
ncbi:hypothetical protein DPSP01_004462 [Paraphaeosphaeria sporulosa]|uniref:Uncharacterized protein n=1 Tax=Paraphaeosphaeria sporulosa TaxID=1460663 RepID=A0A177CJ79_9PLEO|nr:uncharacterized protein CC84DRAFT_1163286 [Paraphaeosphaeria sporulosa]OAG07032.1 hypothetical protein CC84DRAFT_1163286 [Paraphaeosphaeria sporulosa]